MPVFTRKAKRRLTSHPRFLWFDAGVFRSIRPAGPLDRPQAFDGHALEGLAAQHLRAWIDFGGFDAKLSPWQAKAFAEDYPQAELRLLHRGPRRTKIDGVLCLPVAEFLAELRPGSALPS